MIVGLAQCVTQAAMNTARESGIIIETYVVPDDDKPSLWDRITLWKCRIMFRFGLWLIRIST